MKQIFFLFAVVLCLAASACGSNNDQPTVLVYSGRGENLIAPLLEEFSNQSGIKVIVRYGSTAELANTLLEEGQNTPADVFLAQDPGGLGVVADAGLLAPLPADIRGMVDARFVSQDDLWVGISGRARVVIYNTDMLTADDLPEDMWGFTDPKWLGRIGLPPTNASFRTMITAMRQIWGEQTTREWLEGILANEPIYYEDNTSTVAAVEAGEVAVGFVNHYYLYRFLAEEGETFAARNYFLPAGGPGSLIMVSGVGQTIKDDKTDLALQLIRFLLEKEAQEYFSENTYEYPLAAGVSPDVGLPPLSTLNTLEISLGDLADLRGTVKLMQAVGMLP